jgi:hypothetical protein
MPPRLMPLGPKYRSGRFFGSPAVYLYGQHAGRVQGRLSGYWGWASVRDCTDHGAMLHPVPFIMKSLCRERGMTASMYSTSSKAP